MHTSFLLFSHVISPAITSTKSTDFPNNAIDSSEQWNCFCSYNFQVSPIITYSSSESLWQRNLVTSWCDGRCTGEPTGSRAQPVRNKDNNQLNFPSIYRVAAIIFIFFFAYQNFCTQPVFTELFYLFIFIQTPKAISWESVIQHVPQFLRKRLLETKARGFILSVVSPLLRCKHTIQFLPQVRSFRLQTSIPKIHITQETKIYLNTPVLTQAL